MNTVVYENEDFRFLVELTRLGKIILGEYRGEPFECSTWFMMGAGELMQVFGAKCGGDTPSARFFTHLELVQPLREVRAQVKKGNLGLYFEIDFSDPFSSLTVGQVLSERYGRLTSSLTVIRDGGKLGEILCRRGFFGGYGFQGDSDRLHASNYREGDEIVFPFEGGEIYWSTDHSPPKECSV